MAPRVEYANQTVYFWQCMPCMEQSKYLFTLSRKAEESRDEHNKEQHNRNVCAHVGSRIERIRTDGTW